MMRLFIYSILFVLIIMTVYVRFVVHPEQRVAQDESRRDEMKDRPFTPSVQTQNDMPSVSEEPPPVVLFPIEAGGTTSDNKPAGIQDSMASKAIESFKAGDYEQSLRFFRELSETDKSAYIGMGACYYRLNDYSNAIVFLEKAVEFNKSDFSARKLLAFTYYKRNDFEKSLLNAEAAISMVQDAELLAFYDRLKKESRTQKNYTEESTEHFRIMFDGHEHGKVDRAILRLLEDAYGLIGRELDYFPREPVTVILYTSRDFHDTTQAPLWAGGFFDGKIRIPVRGISGQTDLLKKVLYHEYTHALVHSVAPKCPQWFNEGLAEYFSARYPNRIGQVIPLKNIENSFFHLSGRQIPTAYQESYSAVSHLAERYGRHAITKFISSLSQGSDNNQAFRTAFGMAYDDFIAQWGKN
ncbi:MAG: hypothetical protein HZA17_01810 [Nitrospirae bacterium]|nr:hypothetical protein [Nitrospirota bacterium]